VTSAVHAGTWLFVPGDAPHRFHKAAGSGADAVIVDLEDAVSPGRRDEARTETRRWLDGGGQAWVRVDRFGAAGFDRDLDAVTGTAGLLGVILPKAEAPRALAELASRLGPGVGLVALIETALGLHRVHDVAAAVGLTRLAFGSLDFAADIRADDSPDAMLLARNTIVLASRIAGLAAPIDGVSTVIRDADALERSARHSRSLGFRDKLCIHPAQIGPTARGLAYSDDEIAWARDVLRAAEGSLGVATGSDGQMIDKPVVDRARSILEL